MSDELKPALTAEEWETLRRSAMSSVTFTMDLWSDSQFAGVVAASNFLLPDDDPRKIVPQHVRALRETADAAREMAERYGVDRLALASEITRRLAAKLAALLPPES